MDVKIYFDRSGMHADVSSLNIQIPDGDTFNPRPVKIKEIVATSGFGPDFMVGRYEDGTEITLRSSWWRVRDKGFFIASMPGSFKATGIGKYYPNGYREIVWGNEQKEIA